MFNWLGQRGEKRKQKTRRLWENEFKIADKGLDEKQVIAFVNDLIAKHKASQQAATASLRSLLKTAVTDAEQVAASIKMKAQTEAEAEAAMIISQANQEAQETKRRAEIAIQKEAEEVQSAANRKAQITEVEAKQKALLFLLRAREDIEEEIRGEYKRAHTRLFSFLQNLVSEGQKIEMELRDKRAELWASKSFELKEYEATLPATPEAAVPSLEELAPVEEEIKSDMATEEKIEEPVQLQEEALEEKVEEPVQLEKEAEKKKEGKKKGREEEKIEEPVQLQEETTVSELVEAATEELLEQRSPEERPSNEEIDFTTPSLDSQALYTGEVDLAIAMPVDLKMVSKLHNHLQTIPELRIVHTTGSWDEGTIITVSLEKPIPLISLISKIPDVEVTAKLLEKEGLARGKSSSLLRGEKRGAKSIKLTLKEAQTPS